MNKFIIRYWVFMSVGFLLAGCSTNQLAVNTVADILADEKSTVFTGDDDPELVGEALPFGLKLHESLLAQSPNHRGLLLATGRACALYSFGYVQTPADQLPAGEIEKQLEMYGRAKRLYLRARGYVLRGLELKHPGITELLQTDPDEAVAQCEKEDVPFLYWAGITWMAAFAVDKFDMDLSVTHPSAVKMIGRVLELDEEFDQGAGHEFFVSYYGTLPPAMGGSEEKARAHYEKALKFSKGLKAGVYLALANSVDINRQDQAEFESLLGAALAIDVNQNPKNRLLNVINQRRAQWLLKNKDRYFLQSGGTEDDQ